MTDNQLCYTVRARAHLIVSGTITRHPIQVGVAEVCELRVWGGVREGGCVEEVRTYVRRDEEESAAEPVAVP